MSKRYKLVKQYYDAGLWSKKRVRDAVIKEWISTEEYHEIIGEEFTADGP